MKKILVLAALCALSSFAHAQEKKIETAKAKVEKTSETDNVLELRYIKIPREHRENSIMIEGEKYELWQNKGRAEHIYKTKYLPKNEGKTIIYVRSDEEKEPETIRFDK